MLLLWVGLDWMLMAQFKPTQSSQHLLFQVRSLLSIFYRMCVNLFCSVHNTDSTPGLILTADTNSCCWESSDSVVTHFMNETTVWPKILKASCLAVLLPTSVVPTERQTRSTHSTSAFSIQQCEFKWVSLSMCMSSKCFFVLNDRQVSLQSDSEPIKPFSLSPCFSSSSSPNHPSDQAQLKVPGLGPAMLTVEPLSQIRPTNKSKSKKKIFYWKIKKDHFGPWQVTVASFGW